MPSRTARQRKSCPKTPSGVFRNAREFSEQFDSTVIAHATGADRGDPHAQPQVVKHVCEGDTVKLKSVGRPAVVAGASTRTTLKSKSAP